MSEEGRPRGTHPDAGEVVFLHGLVAQAHGLLVAAHTEHDLAAHGGGCGAVRGGCPTCHATGEWLGNERRLHAPTGAGGELTQVHDRRDIAFEADRDAHLIETRSEELLLEERRLLALITGLGGGKDELSDREWWAIAQVQLHRARESAEKLLHLLLDALPAVAADFNRRDENDWVVLSGLRANTLLDLEDLANKHQVVVLRQGKERVVARLVQDSDGSWKAMPDWRTLR